MMKKYMLLSVLLLSNKVLAYNTSDTLQVQVTGQIISSVCEVAIDSTVDLGQVPISELYTSGKSGAYTNFDINLTKCSPDLSRVVINATGPRYPGNESSFANQLSDGAKNVGLQLITADSKINLVGNVSIALDPKDGSDVIHLRAQLTSPDRAAGAGNFQSTVTLNITYE